MAYINGKDGIYAPTMLVATKDDIREFIERKCTAIILPEGIKELGNYSFYGCSELQELILPNGLISIGAYALASCGITTLTIPTENLDSMGSYAVSESRSLQSVRFLPNSKNKVPALQTNTFLNAYNLIDIYVPWGEGEVAGAPWGRSSATIHYNSVG